MYVKVGDFHVSRGPSTFPLISSNVVFLKSQNLRKEGTLCICSDGSDTCAGGAPYDVNGGYFVNAPDLN
jgi:hypothetical protein